MRYTILRPSEPVDPRSLALSSLDALYAALPVYQDCDLQVQAMQVVRTLYPDSVVMPVPITIGSGEIFLLGVLPDIGAPRAAHGKIPFVLFVHAVSQHGADAAQIKKRQQWDKRLWKPPVLRPPATADVDELQIELRASDLDQPTRMTAKGYLRTDRQGFVHQVIYLELGDVEMSIEIEDPVTLGR